MIQNVNARKVIFIVCAVLCLTGLVTPPIALLLGLLVAQFVGHPYIQHNKKYTTILLQVSVVGLGFGMDLHKGLEAVKEGFVFTLVSIVGTLILGALLGKFLKIERNTSHLVSSGTAICGGSAIAAIAPVLRAEEHQISVALGIVFILNSIALFIFPPIGKMLHMTDQQFGMWSAVAIHDTSSVVGAASAFSEEALKYATTIKLMRALWIIPLALASAYIFKSPGAKIKIPYFIGYFVIAMCINTYVPGIDAVATVIV